MPSVDPFHGATGIEEIFGFPMVSRSPTPMLDCEPTVMTEKLVNRRPAAVEKFAADQLEGAQEDLSAANRGGYRTNGCQTLMLHSWRPLWD